MRFVKSIICALTLVSQVALARGPAKSTETVVLTEKNHVMLRGEVNESSVGKVQQFLITSPEKDVYLYIDSPGGSIFDGLNLIETMQGSGKNITCVANTAASMAFIILEACTTRGVTNSALVMQHVAAYGLRGQEPNNYTFADLVHRLQRELEERQAERIGMDVEAFRAKTRNDWWLFGRESVKEGVADKVLSVRCDEKLAKGKVTEKVQVLFWTMDVTFSTCPLLTAPLEVAKQRIGIGHDEEAQRELIDVLGLFNVRETVKGWKRDGIDPRDRYESIRYLPY